MSSYHDYGYDPDDPDAPQPMDLDEAGDEDEVIACPACGGQVHESATICPRCGEWLSADSSAAQRSRGWFWPLSIGLLVAMILVAWVGMG